MTYIVVGDDLKKVTFAFFEILYSSNCCIWLKDGEREKPTAILSLEVVLGNEGHSCAD